MLNICYVHTSTFFTLVLKVKFNFTLPGVNRMRNCGTGHHTYPMSLLTRKKILGFPSVSLVIIASNCTSESNLPVYVKHRTQQHPLYRGKAKFIVPCN